MTRPTTRPLAQGQIQQPTMKYDTLIRSAQHLVFGIDISIGEDERSNLLNIPSLNSTEEQRATNLRI
jgi:hypothetical protein